MNRLAFVIVILFFYFVSLAPCIPETSDDSKKQLFDSKPIIEEPETLLSYNRRGLSNDEEKTLHLIQTQLEEIKEVGREMNSGDVRLLLAFITYGSSAQGIIEEGHRPILLKRKEAPKSGVWIAFDAVIHEPSPDVGLTQCIENESEDKIVRIAAWWTLEYVNKKKFKNECPIFLTNKFDPAQSTLINMIAHGATFNGLELSEHRG